MKKTIVFALACFSSFGMFSQKKTNGIIYVDHPAITIVENFHKAFVNGDVNKVSSFISNDFKPMMHLIIVLPEIKKGY